MIRILTSVALAAAAMTSLPAAAQTSPAAAADIDPARLAEARKLIEIMMPPAIRDRMVTGIVDGVTQTMAKGILENPDLLALMDKKPGSRDVMLRFIERERQHTLDEMRQNMPGMLDAMAKAYARRFTVPQMRELAAFFGTPTGQLYIIESATILSDPDISAWMQQLMRRSMDRMPDVLSTLRKELEALD